MAWYPDWVVALDDVSKGLPHATITQKNAQDIITQLEELQAKIKLLEQRPRGMQIGSRNIQTNTF